MRKNSLKPYLEIMRLHNLTGFFLLLMPCWWSIGLAMKKDVPYLLFALFALGAIVMRSAGCVINDIVDRKVDAKVQRTKNRPLSKGTLKLYEALLLLFLLLSIGAAILFNLNSTAIMLGYIIIVPIFVYPFMKRITYWPQLFLAFTINWGALMGWAAVRNEISMTAVFLYIACMFWTLGYDTIYAYQDKEDDAMLGIKSTALKFGENTKKYLYIFYFITIALLWLIGIFSKTGILYHVFLVIAGIQLFWQVYTLNINKSEDCMRKFKSNRYFGFIVLIAVISGHMTF